MSSPWIVLRPQCNVGFLRGEQYVKVSLTFDHIQFYHYIQEKKEVLRAAGSSGEYY